MRWPEPAEGEGCAGRGTEAAERLDESMTEASGHAPLVGWCRLRGGRRSGQDRMGSGRRRLADYAAKARDIGGDIGNALVGAFTRPRTPWASS
jgi:hypothetical protein